jgi:NAD(P)-dependent dehydrogenase (short-subunit alcohol dehydrogenase family)
MRIKSRLFSHLIGRGKTYVMTQTPSSPTSKIALITGANKGIGFEVAREIARSGATVLIGARSPERGREAAAKLIAEGLDARAVEIDVTSSDSVTAAAAQIERDFGRLDILVNNAGIAAPGDGPPSKVSIDAIEHIFATNFLGAVRVAQTMLPLLRKSAAGRIVNVSSGLGSLTQHSDPGWPFAQVKVLGYCASKAALNMLTVQLAWELSDTNIKVNSADPGYTATDLNHHSGHQTIEQGAAETIRLALLPGDGPTGGYFDTAGPVPW